MGAHADELLGKMAWFLDGYCSDRDLETWVVAYLQRILDSGDVTAIHLANEIDASFVELGEGIIDPPTFNKHLRSLVTEAGTPS